MLAFFHNQQRHNNRICQMQVLKALDDFNKLRVLQLIEALDDDGLYRLYFLQLTRR